MAKDTIEATLLLIAGNREFDFETRSLANFIGTFLVTHGEDVALTWLKACWYYNGNSDPAKRKAMDTICAVMGKSIRNGDLDNGVF